MFLFENTFRQHVPVILMQFWFCKNFSQIVSSIWEFDKGTLHKCVIREICWRNVKYITTGGKDWWALKGHKYNMPWKGFVFKEDQKSQIFLQLTVLLWNIARNSEVSRRFNIKPYLFFLEKASREQASIIFLEEIRLKQEKEMWFFLVT